MKKIIMILLSCAYGNSYAQKTTKVSIEPLDQATIKCYYLFSKTKEGAELPYRKDTMVLDLGAKMSRFYDPARLGRDSVVAGKIKNLMGNSQDIKSIHVYQNADARDLSNMPGTISTNSNQGESYQIYKDRLNSHIKIVDRASAEGNDFLIEDAIGKLPWQIENETDTILGYVCQKAKLSFRGRDYIAWFAADIPVNDGPWKFMGLPGLILKVEDSMQLFSFTIIGLQQLSLPLPISINEKATIKSTRAEFEKLKKKQGAGIQYNNTGGNVILSSVPGVFEYIPMEIKE